MTTDHRVPIYFENGFAPFDRSKAHYTSSTADSPEKLSFLLALQKARAIILHPSFCCPLVIEPHQPIELFLLMEKELKENFILGEKIEDENSPSKLYVERINLQLNHRPWKNRVDQKQLFKHPEKGTNFFKHGSTGAKLNITSTEPKEVDPKSDLVLTDEKGYTVGHVSAAVLSQYAANDYKYFARITIKDHNLAEGLHNLNFLAVRTEPSKQHNPIAPFYVPQDVLLEKSLKEYRTKIRCAFRIPYESVEDFSFSINTGDPIEALHPVLVTNKEKLGFGHLTDVHVSARQHVFKKCTLQVIPGACKTVSPPIGELVHACFDSLKDLLDQMGKHPDVDMLFVTGDLVDFSLNLDPTLTSVKEGKLWELMELKKRYKLAAAATEFNTLSPQNKLEETHTPGIDNTIVYSLFKYFYDRYQKPIFLTSGNHDSYAVPFGISPRKMGVKANAGIPMDHNLTFYEAILMFGKGYPDILEEKNFDIKQSNWFYHVFTPTKDFSFKYKGQVFSGLEWGGDEALLTNVSSVGGFGGFLPRANDMLNKCQIKILEDSVKRSEGKEMNTLFTHATIVNYESTIPLSQKGQVRVNDGLRPGFSSYDHGSFYNNRKLFYKDYIVNAGLTHTFSGHSHRSALYVCTQGGPGVLHDLDPEISENWEYIHTQGYSLDPRKNAIGSCFPLDTKQTKIIVTGSGGPIPIENLSGELTGLGLGIPSGTIVTFKGGKEQVQILYARNKTAKPRFAVALDAFEVIGKNPIFTRFECDRIDIPVFYVELHEKLISIAPAIQKFTLYFRPDDEEPYRSYTMTLQLISGSKKAFKVIPNNSGTLGYDLTNIVKRFSSVNGFLNIEFSDVLQKQPEYHQYDFRSPLLIFIKVNFGPSVHYGCKIYRDRKCGEIPDFSLYKNIGLNK